MGRLILKKHSGFTLIELLIVVAIIGILATVGVPTFKKMTQKAKKSEAKVALGGVFTAESAFQAEYGVYGNFLNKVGFEMASNPSTYTIGFIATDAGCVASTTRQPDAAVPKANLTAAFPTYYVDTPFSTRITPAGGASGSCSSGDVSADGSTFTATGTAVISPKFAITDATPANQDRWFIDQNRNLSNVVDGVQ